MKAAEIHAHMKRTYDAEFVSCHGANVMQFRSRHAEYLVRLTVGGWSVFGFHEEVR